MEARGIAAYLVVTEAFRPLVEAQARARNVEPRLVVVQHPVGGLSEAELSNRTSSAVESLVNQSSASA